MHSQAISEQQSVKPLLTRKMLSHIAYSIIDKQTGIFSENDIYEELWKKTQDTDQQTLLQEAIWSITRQTIATRAKPKMADSDDWVGYGDMVINLPEGELVHVNHASKDNLDVRKGHVLKNLVNAKLAAKSEVKRIKTIQKIMDKHNFKTAGQAIAWLAQQ